MPEYDNVLLSHADRSRFGSDEDRRFAATTFKGSVLVDWRAQAVWHYEHDRKTKRVTLVVEHLRLTTRAASAVAAEAGRAARFWHPGASGHEVHPFRSMSGAYPWPVTDAEQILEAAGSILVVDWPSRDVPETLARAGFTVVVKSGPGPDDYTAHESSDGEIVVHPIGHAPDHADIVYAHRPLEELPGIVTMARAVGAGTVWYQSGVAAGGASDPKGCWLPDDQSRAARATVESAGLSYVDDTYLADAVRRRGIQKW